MAAREEAERKAKVGGDDFGGFGGFGGGGAQPPEGEKKEAAEPPEEEGKEEPVVGEGQEGGEGEEEVDVPASAEGSVASLEEDSTQQLGSVERQLTEERNIRCVWCGLGGILCMYVYMCFFCMWCVSVCRVK